MSMEKLRALDRANFKQRCLDLEHWEIAPWATPAVLRKELLTERVVDPCCGTGLMTIAARAAGYTVCPLDVHYWGFTGTIMQDWLAPESEFFGLVKGATVLMNPPFSKSEAFVEKAFELGARKVVCFNRFNWYEGSYDKGKKRGEWWERNRPARIWLCGDRAVCWRHDVPIEERNEGTPTSHAFFVWEEGHAPAAVTGHIYKS